MNYVYLSHCADESFPAGQLRKLLKESFDVWCPFQDVPYGADASEFIPEKIKNAAAMIIVLSKGALSSKQVSRELNLADKYSTPIIPVAFDYIELSGKFEYVLCDCVIRNVRGFESDYSKLNLLISDIKKYVKVKSEQPVYEFEPSFNAFKSEIASAIDSLSEISYFKEEPKKSMETLISELTDSKEETPSVEEEISLSEENVDEEYTLPKEEEEKRYEKFLPLLKEESAESIDYFKAGDILQRIADLISCYGVDCEPSLVTDGPAFTRYICSVSGEVSNEILDEVRVVLADHLETDAPVDIYYDDENASVFADVPLNKAKEVFLSSALNDEDYQNENLLFTVGKDVNENFVFANAKNDGRLLILNGSEEENTEFLTNAVLSLAIKNSANELSVIISDATNKLNLDIPHLSLGEIIKNPSNEITDRVKITAPLNFIKKEMNKRAQAFEILSDPNNRISNLDEYNRVSDDEKLKEILVVINGIDESFIPFADIIEEKLAAISGCEKYGVYFIMSAKTGVLSESAVEAFESKLSFRSSVPTPCKAEKLYLENELVYRNGLFTVRAIGAASSEEERNSITALLNELDEKQIDESAYSFIKRSAVKDFNEIADREDYSIMTLEEPIAEDTPVVEEPTVEEINGDINAEITDNDIQAELVINDKSELEILSEEITEEIADGDIEVEIVESQEEDEITVEDISDEFEIDEDEIEIIINGDGLNEGKEAKPTFEIFAELYEGMILPEDEGVEEIIPEEESEIIEETVVEEIPEVTEEPVVEETPEVTKEIAVEEIPEVTEETVVEEILEVADEPVVEEIPEVTEETAIEEFPEVTKETAVEELPEVTDEPVVEEIHEVTDEPVVEEIPEVTEETVVEEILEVIEETVVEEVIEEREVSFLNDFLDDEDIIEIGKEELSKESEIIEDIQEESVAETVEELTVEEIPETTEELIVEEVPEVTEEPIIEEIPEIIEEPIIEALQEKFKYVPVEERPEKIYLDALKAVIKKNRASVSTLQQRPLMLNYTKARNLLDWMTAMGYVSEPDPLGNRDLLVTMEDYEKMYGE